MRAGAASSFQAVQEVLTAQPDEPCAVLLGNKLARDRVRRLLETALGFAGDRRAALSSPSAGPGVRGEALRGLVLVEPPDILDVAEITELATFLKGLQHLHGLLIARSAGDDSDVPGQQISAPDVEEEVAPLVANFYGQQDTWKSLVVVAVIDTAREDDAMDAAREAICQHGLEVPGAPAPKVFRVDIGDEARRLVHWLSQQEALPCEPLQVNSQLMQSYRVITQQLGCRRRPASKQRARPGAPGAVDSTGGSAPPTPQGAREQRPAAHEPGDLKSPSQAGAPPACGTPAAPAEPAPAALPASPTSLASPSSAGGGTDSASAARRQVPGEPFGKWTVMVFGKTGAGKSHLANLMLDHNAFVSGDSLASVTNTDSVRRAVSTDGTITLLDTIGFGDTKLPPETVMASLRDTALEAPHGIDVLLFVMKKERVTPVEQEILAYVTQLLFGPDCLPNLYMVVTHAGRLAKDLDMRGPWLKEQSEASPVFAAMLAFLGPEPIRKIAFVENSDTNDAEDDDDRALAAKRRKRAFADVWNLLEAHRAPPYRHGIMRKAGEFQRMHMDEMRKELQARIESEVRKELDKEKGDLEVERKKLQSDVEAQKKELMEQEELMKRRFEEEWGRMKGEFEAQARDLAREDLEPLAKDIVESTEKKAKDKGRWCVVQ